MPAANGMTEGQGGPVKLAVLVPSHETWMADFSLSVLALQQFLSFHPLGGEGFEMNLVNERGSLISYQRENLAQRALDDNCTHLLWLDSDMKFPPNLAHLLYRHDLPVVACNYVKRSIPAMPNTKKLDGKLLPTNRDSHGLEEAMSAGFGAVMMQAEVLKQVPRPWFDLVWFERPGKDEPELMGEDVFFWKKARHHGIPLFIDHDASQHVAHVGSFEYTNALCAATWDELEGAEGIDDAKRVVMG